MLQQLSRNARFLILVLTVLVLTVVLTACSSGTSGTAPESKNVDPKTLKNPHPATPESIASGKRVYTRLCQSCHGTNGDGVTGVAPDTIDALGKSASDLTDDQWAHGSTDGELFTIIRDGLGPTSQMQGINGKAGIYPQEIWETVNYIRSLHRSGVSAAPPHP
jgi:mono/diheme cytochrome c family protein